MSLNQLVGTENDAVINAILEVPRTPSFAVTTITSPVQHTSVETFPLPRNGPDANELRLIATDKHIFIDRINQELERVKNSSVALIAQFDLNCGSWSDDCFPIIPLRELPDISLAWSIC